ncbi:72 kDa type IV collagenase [Lepeophtheirus salmonis]|uniref:72 kDa type IV collagenase n=1 Tax=Lepeophtheirus salmonis TaxID=72036 RepID=UPI001AE72B9B|nr:seminal plasma protein HSP-1-like isoform X1 [Lepeophtheirus salmonis]
MGYPLHHIFLLSALLFLNLSGLNGQCTTTNGDNCIFPFNYNGVRYVKCTNVDYGNTLWCATSLFSNGDAQGYGTCANNCEDSAIKTTVKSSSKKACNTVNGASCIFPFKYLGKTYEECTNVDYGSTMWCATSLYSNGEYNGYGICDLNSCKDVGTGTGVTTAYIVISPL